MLPAPLPKQAKCFGQHFNNGCTDLRLLRGSRLGDVQHLNPMPYEAAAQMEKDLAEALRRAGYTVAGGH